MRVSAERIAADAAATGFRSDMLEKAIHLLGLLDVMCSHPFLKGKLALKGGTALNLFVFDVPRLSVDIDLNYVGNESREAMLEERPRLEEAIQAVFSREDFSIRRIPQEHAGGKWSLRYAAASISRRIRAAAAVAGLGQGFSGHSGRDGRFSSGDKLRIKSGVDIDATVTE